MHLPAVDDHSDEEKIIFVAMPGTITGGEELWKDVENIKKYLYERVALDVSTATGVDYRVRIEVDEYRPGNIHQSMFGAALHAPVYIADLTGLNANVYLELGVRWAVRDNVTVLTCQNLQNDLAFNVSPSKAVEYGNDAAKLESARAKIVDMIVKGLRDSEHVDSLVRQGSDLLTVNRNKYQALHDENIALHQQRGDDLIAAARKAPHVQKVELLTRAITNSPTNPVAWFDLGVAMIKVERYAEAIDHLSEATQLDSSSAVAWQKLGVAQSRHGVLDAALASLRRSAVLDPNDDETHSNLGGTYRRKAREHYERAGSYDLANLRQARDSYDDAGKIDKNNTYPLMNMARLDLQFAGQDAEQVKAALLEFERLEFLARFNTGSHEADNGWTWIDLADALAFNGKQREALEAARSGLLKFEEPERAATGTAAADPLQDILNQTLLPANVETAVRALVEVYRAAG